MPRIEYRALTLRMETYERIVRAVHRAKKKNHRMYTSTFLDMLLDTYENK